MKKLKILVLSTLIILTSNFAFSQKQANQKPEPNKNFGIENRIPNLSDEQKEQIKNERTKFMSDILPIKNQLKEKQAHLNTLQTAKEADLKAINKTIDEISALRTDIMKRRAVFIQNVRKNLNDEQRVYYDTHMAHKKAKGKKHMMHKKSCK